MITQRVSPKKIGSWEGILIIAGIVALLLGATALVNVVKQRANPLWGQISVLLLAGLGAYFLMRGFILEFQYTVDKGVFYIERLYGQRTKVMLQLPLKDILYLGDEKQAAAKWPEARVMINATVGRAEPNTPQKTCFAYRKDGQVQLGLIQANDDIQRAMYDPEARERDAKEKWGE